MDAHLLAKLKRLTEPQWAELRLRAGDRAADLPSKNASLTEQAVALAQLAANDPALRARIDRFLGKSGRLDLVLVVVEAEFPGLPARLTTSLGRLRGIDLHLRHIDPTRDPLPPAGLYVVVLGAAVGQREVFEGALQDPERCIGLLLDPLSQEQKRPYKADRSARDALVDRFEERLLPFAEDPVAALEAPLADWLEQHFPDSDGLLRPYERAYLLAREPDWEAGSMRHLAGLVRTQLPGQSALSREQMYVSLHAGPGPWGRNEDGQAELRSEDPSQPGRLIDRRELAPGRRESPLFLDELLSLPGLSHALVEGEAGSGKTVLLQHLALSLARVLLRRAPPAESRLSVAEPPIPVYFLASALDPSGCPDVLRCFADHLAGLLGTRDDLDQDLRQGRYWLLIDALDEVPGIERRQAMLNALRALAKQAPKLRLALTSRPGAHTGLGAPAPLRVLPIAPLNKERRGALITHWGQGQGFTAAQIADAQAKINSLEERFPEDPEGRSPLSNPLLCTAALLVYWQAWQLPNNLTDLYQRLIAALCRAREGAGESAESFQRELMRVARALQESGGTQLTLGKAAAALDPQNPLAAEARIERLVNATGVLRTELSDRGVVVRPWHRSFQEYLAATSLLDTAGSVDETVDWLREDRGKQPSRLHDPFWTGTLRMAVGVFGVGAPTRAQALVDALLRDAAREEGGASPEARRREGHLLALAISGVREYRDASFEDSPLLQALPERVAHRYEAGGPDWAWRDRVEALDALGALGDPRLPDPRESLAGWVFVDAAERRIGSTDFEEFLNPLPPQTFRHGALWVRRHPVTVAEYAEFLKVADSARDPGDWGRQALHPTRPVVDVSWHDARAFCAWAQQAWRLPGPGVLDLPTSREWEAVALGDRGGPFPWGEPLPREEDRSRAAYRWDTSGAAPHKAALPVGAFPAGHAGGLWDLAGNVWEWCASTFDPRTERDLPRLSPYDPRAVTDVTNVDAERVLRGGSWHNDARDLRCAYRLWVHPQLRNPGIGFRVVVRVPPASTVEP